MKYKLTKNKTDFNFKKAPGLVCINAEGVVLGRLASFIAHRLRGKHLRSFTPNSFSSEKIVIYNVDKIAVSGNKFNSKISYRHTGFPGGLRSRLFKDIVNGKVPSDAIRLAIKGMLSKGPLFYKMLNSISFYSSKQDFKPQAGNLLLDFKSLNSKNAIVNA